MIKAVIYDLDDLMVDSDPLHQEADFTVFAEYTSEKLPDEMISGFVGKRVIEIIEDTINYLKLDLDPAEIYSKRNVVFLEIVKERLEMLPGLLESLEFFKCKNYPLAIASSGAKQYIDMVLDKFNLRSYFKVIITGDDVKKGKPNPEVYIKTAKSLKVKPSECLVLEDAAAGVKAAKSAGCKCIAIQSPSTLPQDHSLADLTLSSLREINSRVLSKLA